MDIMRATSRSAVSVASWGWGGGGVMRLASGVFEVVMRTCCFVPPLSKCSGCVWLTFESHGACHVSVVFVQLRGIPVEVLQRFLTAVCSDSTGTKETLITRVMSLQALVCQLLAGCGARPPFDLACLSNWQRGIASPHSDDRRCLILL